MLNNTIKTDTLRNNFAKSGAKKIGTGLCSTKPVTHNIVLDKFVSLQSGISSDKKLNKTLDNIILFKKQKEVA